MSAYFSEDRRRHSGCDSEEIACEHFAGTRNNPWSGRTLNRHFGTFRLVRDRCRMPKKTKKQYDDDDKKDGGGPHRRKFVTAELAGPATLGEYTPIRNRAPPITAAVATAEEEDEEQTQPQEPQSQQYAGAGTRRKRKFNELQMLNRMRAMAKKMIV